MEHTHALTCVPSSSSSSTTASMAELEQHLTLCCATAIEDKLQDGVPETIHQLAQVT